MNIGDILQEKLRAYSLNPEGMKRKSKQYTKDWNFAVGCFQKRINKDRKKEGKPDIEFMAVRMKLMALQEINDMRWFYRECTKRAGTIHKKTGEVITFSWAFFSALKPR
jgi:hypothetical protein